jgi:predicted amidohydrolase
MEHLRLCLLQHDIAWEQIDLNLKQYDAYLQQIDEPTDIVILPEMFTTAFTMQAAPFAETMGGKTTKWLQQWAKRLDAAMVGSLIMQNEAGQYVNRLLWVMPDGAVLYYDKRHLFRMGQENEVYTAGKTDKLLVNFRGWVICPLVCYDLRFPVWARNRFDQQAYDVLLYVANWPQIRQHPWRTLLQARAIENLCYCVGVNRCGTDDNGLYHSGNSLISDFQGKILIEQVDKAALLTYKLSKTTLEQYRTAFPAWKDADVFSIED